MISEKNMKNTFTRSRYGSCQDKMIGKLIMMKTEDSSSVMIGKKIVPVLILLIGLPGTGKSTYRKTLTAEYPDLIQISSDDFIESYASQRGKTYDEVFDEAVKLGTQTVNELADKARKEKRSLIWDQTNLSIKKRKSILDKFKKYVKIAVYFEPPSNWEDILASRPGKTIPKHVLKSMADSYQEPTLEEGFDTVYQYVMRKS